MEAGAGRGRTGHLYLLLCVSRMLSPGLSTFPFFNQTRRGSGTPWATQVKMALLPGGLDKDCGHWTNSGGAGQAMGVGVEAAMRPGLVSASGPCPSPTPWIPWGDGVQDPPHLTLGAHLAQAKRPAPCAGHGCPAGSQHRRRCPSVGPTRRRS